MKRNFQSILFLFFLFFTVRSAFSDSTGAFEKLKALEGKWEGTAKWSGARTSEYKMDAVYSLTGNGTAVVENLIVENKTMMTSVYHMDGDTLRMTHFCGTGNQPRLKASSYDPESSKVVFEMVDITNLSKPESPHVFGAEMVFQSQKEITLSFQFTGDGKISTELIRLHRIE
jgi:hypothetical protein